MVEKATTPPEHETWENTGDSRVVLKKYSHAGELIDEMINGRRKVVLTTNERKINQELAATQKMDPFMNGTFAPVRLIETADDLEQIRANPNLMSEGDMKALLKGRVAALETRLTEISSEAVLRRMVEVAEAEDAPVSKLKAVKSRLDEFKLDFVSEVQAAG